MMLIVTSLDAIAHSRREMILLPPVSPPRASLHAQGRTKRLWSSQTRNALTASKLGHSDELIARTWLGIGAGVRPTGADRKMI